MPKEYSRSQRVVEQIRRELAELIRLEVKDPRVGFITLTDVEITPDYAHAKVFFTNMTGEGDVPEILQGLRSSAVSLSIEIPMRLHRGPNAQPSRSAFRVPLADIEARLKAALDFVHHHLNPAEVAA